MTFTAYESSNESGRPIGLYQFTWGNTVWRYTSADRDVEWPSASGNFYAAAAIQDDNLVLGEGNSRGEELTVTFPSNLPVVAMFRGTPPSNPVFMTVRGLHADDPDEEAPVHWIGLVGNISRKDDVASNVVCRTRGLKRAGLRYCWGRTCNHFLFSPQCGLLKVDFATAATITAIDGNEIVVDITSPSPGWFDGGFIEWDADGLGTIENRDIEVETGSGRYAMFGRADWLTVGMSLTMYPGCDLTAGTCHTKFDNLVNTDAMEFLADKSPFEGSALV